MGKNKTVAKIKIALFSIIMLAFLFLLWANFFYFKDCGKNENCFKDYQKTCSRAKYIEDGEIIFSRKIIGRSRDSCIYEIGFVAGELATEDIGMVEGKNMLCRLPVGSLAAPESNIGQCEGALKEGLQDIIISKLQKYIVKNLGEIKEGVL